MRNFFFDIETIPAQSEADKARIAASVKAPGTLKKADSIAAWEKEQKPAAIDEAIAKSSLNGAYGHICCIGWAHGEDEPQSISWSPEIDDGHYNSEGDMLNAFSHAFTQWTSNTYSAPRIIGHFVAGFDLRFMWQRAMVLGVRMPSLLPRNPKPWSSEVFDTMAVWAGDRDTISMDNLCAALGLPGKGEIDGSMVAQMFADGKHNEIGSYCRSDIERTRAIFHKMQVAIGETA